MQQEELQIERSNARSSALWLGAFLVGWVALAELLTLPFALWLHLPRDLQLVVVCPLVLVLGAWVAARLSLPRGAPAAIWVPLLLGSLGTIAMFSLVVLAIAGHAWYLTAVVFVAVGTVAVVLLEARRSRNALSRT